MIPIPPRTRKLIDSDPFFRKCVHRARPGHVCRGRITMEHPYQRRYNASVVVPCCEGANYSPDRETKLFSQYAAMRYWGLGNLKQANPKKDWDLEWKLLSERFGFLFE